MKYWMLANSESGLVYGMFQHCNYAVAMQDLVENDPSLSAPRTVIVRLKLSDLVPGKDVNYIPEIFNKK